MKLKLFLKYLVFIGIFVHNIVYAQNNFIDILDTFDGKFFGAAKGWQREAELLARNIFFSLILIDFIIIGTNYLLDKNKIKTIFNEIIYKLIFSCGFLYIFQLISNFNNTGSTFLSWFGIAGGRISRITQIDITSIFETGISIIVTILHKFPKGVFESYFFCIIISGSIFIILFCFFILGFELLATKIEAYILMFGGSILLAFAGSKFTKQYAIGYIRYTFNLGLKLLFLYLYLSLISIYIKEVKNTIEKNAKIEISDLFIIVLICLIFALIAKRIPKIINGFISGISYGFSGKIIVNEEHLIKNQEASKEVIVVNPSPPVSERTIQSFETAAPSQKQATANRGNNNPNLNVPQKNQKEQSKDKGGVDPPPPPLIKK